MALMEPKFARLLSSLSCATIVAPSAATAMTMDVVRSRAIPSGPIVASDTVQFAKLLDANPNVTIVVLLNSPGGTFVANRGLTKLIEDPTLATAVGGHCVSACAIERQGRSRARRSLASLE